MSWNKEQHLLRIKDSRLLLWTCLHDLSQEELTTIPVEDLWTSKDLIGHITAWDISLLNPLKIYLESDAFSPEVIPDHDVWNALQAEMRKLRTLVEVMEESMQVREELYIAVGELSESQWRTAFPAPWGGMETFAQMIDGLAWHEEEHTKSILARFSK